MSTRRVQQIYMKLTPLVTSGIYSGDIAWASDRSGSRMSPAIRSKPPDEWAKFPIKVKEPGSWRSNHKLEFQRLRITTKHGVSWSELSRLYKLSLEHLVFWASTARKV